jgi:benzoyl-CoA-dihydrodiol lyase
MLTLDAPAGADTVLFETAPAQYRHWRLSVEGRVATLTLDVDEDGGLKPGYKLKLNSYDLGVDIELHDALNRVRFEHPYVTTVVITSGNEKSFCAGANIYMLGTSSHRWKVNFCKFTNETRNGMEDSSAHDGLKFLAAVNGSCAGGGYEVALACDEIVMVDDRTTAVSLPEVPLLGVLPGTGGLTRVVDKRGIRRDLADVFCTNADGLRAPKALAQRFVDGIAPPSAFAALVAERAAKLGEGSKRDANAKGISLTPLNRVDRADGFSYRYVDVAYDRVARTATLTAKAPTAGEPESMDDIVALGDAWWPLAFARELDDAILLLRTNEPELGLILLRSQGDASLVLASDAAMLANADHWLVRETLGLLRRTLARLDVTSRSLYAIVDRGSCFAGTLFELALCADRIYMLAAEEEPPMLTPGAINFGTFPTVGAQSRLATRFFGDASQVAALQAKIGTSYDGVDAEKAGLVTFAPDELDWDDELRLAIEERAALSPDALTAMEANLRFPGPETMWMKVFGRLSAWQNWVFIRPNSTGERGALKLFGSGSKPHFDRERV